MPPTPRPFLPHTSPAAARRARVAVAFALAAWAVAGTCRAATPDLTELSLEELMDVELPPLATTARFKVSATAVDSCVVSATDLSFGTYDPLRPTATEASSEVTVTCTVDSGYTVGLDAGLGAGATVTLRRLTGADATLDYSLYRDAGRALVWGNTAGSDTVAGTGTGTPAIHTVYGRIPPGQAVRRGMYVDIITVSVDY
jgi:spore coat protein U-like protein